MKSGKMKLSVISAIAVIILVALSLYCFALDHTHKFTQTQLKQASLNENGFVSYKCDSCEETKTEEIAKISSVTLESQSVKYTGKPCENKVTVKDSSGAVLKNGTDYTLKYENNTAVGTAGVTVTFKGFYSGSEKKTYKITHDHTYGSWTAVKRATTKADGRKQKTCTGCGYVKSAVVPQIKSVALTKKTVEYTGKAIKVSVKAVDNKNSKISGKNYDVKYSENKNVGTANVTITFKGLYKGKVTKTFKINPVSTSLVSVTAGSKEMLVKWRKQSSQTTGYQVQYAADKAFKKNVKSVVMNKNTRTGMMIYDLKIGNRYYVRIRTYLMKGNKKYYSKWSSALSAQTKAPGAHYIEGAVPESAYAPTSYFNDAVFIGDSISLGLTYYEAANDKLGNAQFLTAGSFSATNALWEVSDKSVHPRYNGVKMKLEKSVPLTKANKIYIMLGMNDIGLGLDGAYSNFKTVCENIQRAAPYATIYVESVTPRANQGSKSTGLLNNKNITLHNNKLSKLCREKGWYFINVAEAMFDKSGYLKKEYCGDLNGMGMHFTSAGCAAWVDYLYRHTA